MYFKQYFFLFAALCLFNVVFSQESENLVRNSTFETGKSGWVIKDFNDAEASYKVSEDAAISGDQSLKITVEKGGNADDVQVYQSFVLATGSIYSVGFLIKSDVDAAVRASFYSSSDNSYLWTSPDIQTNSTPTVVGPFEFDCMARDGSYRLIIQLGGMDNVIFTLDDVTVTERDNPDHIRDEEKFEIGEHTVNDMTIPYRFFQPENQTDGVKYPLVLALHGAGERGTDNEIQIMVHRLAFAWSDPVNQAKYPCFVLAPQCPPNEQWVDADWSNGSYRFDQYPQSDELTTVLDLLDQIMATYPVDPDRLYVTGLSMGGFGTWELLMRYPEKFAAAAPMSGGADPAQADNIKHIPTWIFHGELDTTVPVDGSRDMVAAFNAVGVNVVHTHCKMGDCTGMTETAIQDKIDNGAHLLYTEWENKQHVMWAESFDYPLFIPWIFSWSLQGKLSGVESNLPQLTDTFQLSQNYPNPFNPSTVIEYQLQTQSHVKVDVFNATGQHVQNIKNTTEPSGSHKLVFKADHLSAGTYYLYFSVNGFVQIKKMALIK